MPQPPIDLLVTDVQPLTDRIREFTLAAADGSPLPAPPPGAHLRLHAGDAGSGPLVRHYSIVGEDIDGDGPSPRRWRIAVQREDHGGASAWIHDHAAPGTRLRAAGPAQAFALDPRDTHTLLVAGGIGITPIVAMLRSLVRRRRSVAVAYTGGTRQAMAYHDEVRRLAGGRALLHYSGGGQRLDLAALLAGQPPDTTAYVCGPPGLVAAAHATARALGWAADRVRSESFAGQPRAGDAAFDVELRRSRRVLRVGAHASVLDTLLVAGVVDVLWDCRRGECGLCATDIVAADGPIEHRDRCLDAAQQRGGAMCICVSRTTGTRLVLDA
jgi:vanillate O-demethylase ferredoxin subunit